MKTIKLGDVCDLFNGFAFKSNDYLQESNVLNCRMSNIRPDGRMDINYNPKFLPDDYYEKYCKYILKDDDLIIAMTDLANDPKILGVPTFVKTNGKKVLQNQRVGKIIDLDTDKILPEYLRYALQRKDARHYFKKFAGGGVQINIGKKQILECPIPLLSIKQQQFVIQKINEVSALEDRYFQYLNQISLLQDSLFDKMVGESTSENLKKYDLFDLLRMKPQNGYYAPNEQYTSSKEKGTEMVHMSDVFKGVIERGSLKRVIIPEGEVKKYSLQATDILIARRSLNYEGAATPCRIPNSKKPLVFESSLIKLSPNTDIINPTFLYCYLANKKVREKYVKKHIKKATISGINQQGLSKIIVETPCIETQNLFAEKFILTEKLTLKINKNIDALALLREVFNQELFKEKSEKFE